MQERTIYLYWVGYTHKLISILRKLIYLHSTSGSGYNVILITDNNIRSYVKNIPEYFTIMCPAHQADFVRVNVICDYGGIWLDSDTIVLDALDSLFDFIENGNGFFVKDCSNIINSVFGSKPNTQIMIEWRRRMTTILDNTLGKIGWCDIGSSLLEQIYTENPNWLDGYKVFDGFDTLYPIYFSICQSEFVDKPYDNYKTIVREYQPLVILINSVYRAVESMTEQQIIEGNMPLNYFINKSLQNKGIFDTKKYDELVNDVNFIQNLRHLNMSLKNELEKCNYETVLIGNLFYDHEQLQPPFYESPLLQECKEKRIRLMNAAKMKNTMFEVGVNSGHSSFFALSTNNKLKVYGNDTAEFYNPCYRCHPEIYVPKAAEILTELFGERFTFIKGNCIKEIPKFVNNNPDIKIELVHIHGDRNTYKSDFFNIMPILTNEAIVIFDNSNLEYVENMVDELVDHGYLYRVLEFPKMDRNIKYRNEVLLYKKLENKEIFGNIYKTKLWNCGDPSIPLSGPGSSLEIANKCASLLSEFIYNNNCKSVLDLGCGDLNWISKTNFFNDSNIKYMGIDVVETLIASHSENYPNKIFLAEDITVFKEFDSVDIIIIRDVLFHLTNREILSIFDNIKHKFKYLLVTSCTNNENTDNFDKWRFTEKNLNIEPFNKSYYLERNIYEVEFRRNVYIYHHDCFYNLYSPI
jgi:hypothetical protein